MIPMFAKLSKEDVIYLLTVREIAQAQKLDDNLEKLKDQYSTQSVENTEVFCKKGKNGHPCSSLESCSPVVSQLLVTSWTHMT
jgi:hypothetical protein